MLLSIPHFTIYRCCYTGLPCYCRYFTDTSAYYKTNSSMMAVLGYGYGGFVALHTMRKSVTPCAIAVGPLTDLRNLSKFCHLCVWPAVITSLQNEVFTVFIAYTYQYQSPTLQICSSIQQQFCGRIVCGTTYYRQHCWSCIALNFCWNCRRLC